MNFHLEFPIQPKINISNSLLFVGSCFAENIGLKMQQSKFNVCLNPHRILYNPMSISTCLNNCLDNSQINENDLFFANDCWNSWNNHSRYSNTNKEKAFRYKCSQHECRK